MGLLVVVVVSLPGAVLRAVVPVVAFLLAVVLLLEEALAVASHPGAVLAADSPAGALVAVEAVVNINKDNISILVHTVLCVMIDYWLSQAFTEERLTVMLQLVGTVIFCTAFAKILLVDEAN